MIAKAKAISHGINDLRYICLLYTSQIFYSKLHFDLSKSSEQESKAEYYTVKEAMEKFKLSRDSVYYYSMI